MRPLTERSASVARSRLAWLLACIHALWFFLAVANMSPPSPELGEFLENVLTPPAFLEMAIFRQPFF